MRARFPMSPTSRLVALLLIVTGAAVMVIGVFAEFFGLGSGQGIGWKQLIAAIVGLVILLIGIGVLLQPLIGGGPDEPLEPAE